MVSIDDWRQGANDSFRIVDYGVDWRISNNVKIPSKVLIFLLMGLASDHVWVQGYRDGPRHKKSLILLHPFPSFDSGERI